MDVIRHGGCNCKAVRIRLQGQPLRVGRCHCLTCRKQTGAVYMPYAVWRAADVSVTGGARGWVDGGQVRHFCPACGSGLFATDDTDEVEIRLGCLDEAPSGLVPTYELWTVRREAWVPPLPGAVQHTGNRR